MLEPPAERRATVTQGLSNAAIAAQALYAKQGSGGNIPTELSTPATAIIGTAKNIAHRIELMKRRLIS